MNRIEEEKEIWWKNWREGRIGMNNDEELDFDEELKEEIEFDNIDYVYKVQTKHEAKFHALSAKEPSLIISVGDFVIIEADRGESLGIVTEKTPRKNFKEIKACWKETVID